MKNLKKFAKRKTHEELEEFVARRNAIEAQMEKAKKKLAELEAEEKRLHFLDRAKLSAMKARKLRGVQFTPGIYADDENDYIIQLPPYDGD
ncbi:MAG: hypothetical protein WC471_03180 [Candidatus Woesearchaeota archaeon]